MASISEDQGVEHFDFNEKGPAIRFINTINNGGEAGIDKVEVQDTYRGARFVCVRRSYRFHPSRHAFQSLKNAHIKEIGILKKLRNQRHFIELLGSYTRDTQKPSDLALVILQNPHADCDLASLLDKTPEDRQAIISDANLDSGIACLASALYFLHNTRIRHKDISSKNILVHDNQLLFADFGLSMDFSELTDSETSGLVRQQPKYRPPEGNHEMKHSCASDVFSLGCVFFDILTTLSCVNTKFADVQPYRDHLNHIYRRLKNERNNLVTNKRQASTPRQFWLNKTEQMLARPAGQRPRMFKLWWS